MDNSIKPPKNYMRFQKEDIEQSIPKRFEQQVAKYPNHIAVKNQNRELTYRSLNNLSNRVAHTILHRRGESSEPIILLLHQGIELISSIIGALKANKFYVPVDPTYPQRIIELILKDTSAGLIITNTNWPLLNSFESQKQNIINFDELLPETFTDNVNLNIHPDNYAYIYYTSGSIGRPKGVIDNHRNVLHNIMRYTNSLYISPMDRLTLLQSSSFSGAVSSMFCALLNGATVYPFNLKKEGMSNLVKLLILEKVTIYHSVPIIFDHLLMVNKKFPSLRIVRLEGDRVTKRHVDLFQKYLHQGCILVNGLGATETGISRQYFIRSDTKIKGDIIPIGYETEDTKIRIVNEVHKEVPNGEIGEIIVRSRYLAKGYWRSPELTKTAFHAVSNDGIIKDYFTGDLGRFRSDGCLEYLGRKDHRAKVRGHYIEIEAIENAIYSHPSVKDTVVKVIEYEDSNSIIVAYVVPKNREHTEISTIRKIISKKLPAYMAPSKYVTLDSLPTTKNGKIDYSALPTPGKNRPNLEQPFEAARSSIEYDLTKIWEKILEIEKIGIHDNFLDLGGDSLLAFRILHEINKKFGQNLPVEVIFKAPTITELAQFVDFQTEFKDYSFLIPFQKKGDRPPFYLMQCQDTILEYNELANLLGDDHPVYGVHMPWIEHSNYGEISLENMAKFCVKNIVARQNSGPYLLGGFCFGGLLAMEVARQLKEMEQKIGLLVLIESLIPDYEKDFLDKPFIYRCVRQFIYSIKSLKLELNNFECGQNNVRINYIKTKINNFINRILVKNKLYLYNLRLESSLKKRNLSSMVYKKLISTEYRKASLNYTPKPYKGNIVILYSTIQVDNVKVDKTLGWQKYVDGTITCYEIPESHLNLLKKPFVGKIADILKAHLKQIQ
jgi:amino acid adenylation domain-containing protein